MHGTAPVPHQEIELKLELAPASLPTLETMPLFQASKATPKRADQVSVYFDSNKHKLRQKGLMLRVRRQGRRYLKPSNQTATWACSSVTNGKLKLRESNRI